MVFTDHYHLPTSEIARYYLSAGNEERTKTRAGEEGKAAYRAAEAPRGGAIFARALERSRAAD
jgi:hypothetical protein